MCVYTTKLDIPCNAVHWLCHFCVQQCYDTTKLDRAHSIPSHQIMLWQYKSWLYSFYLFSSNNAVTPQNLIVLISFLPIQQYCATTKLHWTLFFSCKLCCDTIDLDCTHSIFPIKQCCDTAKLDCTHVIFFRSNNAVTPQSLNVLIVLVVI